MNETDQAPPSVSGRLLKVRFRRQLFRAFQVWYFVNRARLRFPLRLVRRKDRLLELAVGEIPPEVLTLMIIDQGSGGQEISAYLLKNGEVIDLGFSESVHPVRNQDGLRCSECVRMDSHAPVYENRHLLWSDHLFEPILIWLNQRLAEAAGIEFVCRDGISYVRVVEPGASDCTQDDARTIRDIVFIETPVSPRQSRA